MEATSTSGASSVASSADGRGGGGGGGDYLNLGMFGGGGSGGQVGDLLLGAGAFGGGSLGNGFGNNNDASSNNNNATGVSSSGGASSAFDLSDFPSLGGNIGGSIAGNLSGVGGNIGGNLGNLGGTNGVPQAVGNSGNGLAAALRQQQQLLQHQQMLQGANNNNSNSNNKSSNLYRLAMSSGATPGSNFNMATEDFPALPGAPPTGPGSINNGSAPNSSSLLLGGAGVGGSNARSISVGGSGPFGGQSVSRANSSGSVGGLYGGNDVDNTGAGSGGAGSQLEGGGLLGGAGIGGLGALGALQSNSNPTSSLTGQSRASAPGTIVGSSSNAAVGAGSSVAGTALSGDYGLLGLLGVIRMTDADRNSLALGSDLTLLGLSLGSSDQIYQTFSSPWTESVSSKEPHYQVRLFAGLKVCHLPSFSARRLCSGLVCDVEMLEFGG